MAGNAYFLLLKFNKDLYNIKDILVNLVKFKSLVLMSDISSLNNNTQNVASTATNSAGDDKTVKGLTNILEAMVVKGKITPDEMNQFKFESVNTGKPVEDILRNHKLISPDEIARTKAEMRGLGYIDLSNIFIPVDVLNKITSDQARANMAIIFEETQNKVKAGMKDPLDLPKIKYLESIIGKQVDAYYASEEDIINVIENKYGAQIGAEVTQALEEVSDGAILDLNNIAFTGKEGSAESQDAPIIKIVNMILDYGVKNKASDIHIEPREKKISVRFRVRGLLSEKLTIPKALLPAVVTRIKILSNLKIDEHRLPQDGRFQIKGEKTLVDVRVSVMPSIYGEKTVMRLLEKTEGIMNIDQIGLRGSPLKRFNDSLKKTQGVILVSGPTGSGKTQTLASALKVLNTNEVNIVTLEDPVEVRIDGINQVQVNAEIGLTFANGLRSFLRQDPDIIMVGEIRDSETANLAIQAALVGRLVLSTIHTNSASGAFIRLIDMGVEPFLLSSTVNVVVGQRLVRVLCDCKKAYQASEEVVMELHSQLDILNGVSIFDKDHKLILKFDKNTKNVNLYKPVGCPKCNDTGYSSRTGIFEVLVMSEKIAKAIMNKSSIKEMQDVAISEGMITMVQDGYIKALEGVTTMEEVFRVKNE